LDLRIVAEGVERAAQASRLRELGCDAAQGFYFARPVPPDDLGPYLAEGWLDEAGAPTRSPAEAVASR
ncbi:EAL domain-containing protein, partial [Klebsiella pneumoniae]|uniref:EAL domain-containing protein n=1 Tax=Klebsiella pneumoniae TaxID=573 RepID=UPI003F293851